VGIVKDFGFKPGILVLKGGIAVGREGHNPFGIKTVKNLRVIFHHHVKKPFFPQFSQGIHLAGAAGFIIPDKP
jgi:hypothetical protein